MALILAKWRLKITISLIIESSYESLPTYGDCWIGENRRSVNIPGWSKELEPFRDESFYLGNIWKSSGRPREGLIHQIYNDARRQYHHAVLRVKKIRKNHKSEVVSGLFLERDLHGK